MEIGFLCKGLDMMNRACVMCDFLFETLGHLLILCPLQNCFESKFFTGLLLRSRLGICLVRETTDFGIVHLVAKEKRKAIQSVTINILNSLEVHKQRDL